MITIIALTLIILILILILSCLKIKKNEQLEKEAHKEYCKKKLEQNTPKKNNAKK